MNPRVTIFILMCALHLLTGFLDSEIISPIAAGSIYLPPMGLEMVGIPVFMNSDSGGWASTSVLGWALAFALWSEVWWVLSGANEIVLSLSMHPVSSCRLSHA
ncbi:hypothetical protein Q8A64_01685 [Oxalobacteraceae bacterium R-40]|uniref:Uncharacterized protein n=1 Tax=Keguizhuia sedimenti TaxID=3064264 RepID=A0ABU1BLV1_9BURK|nr:hypothetical protein [Oxalobacteraceae bacterium R-40]